MGIMIAPTSIMSLVALSEASLAASRVGSVWEWYIIRAAGFTAAGLLILLMLSGIGQVTGLTYRFLEPIKAWAVHKAMALALCAAILVHIIFLILDHYISFSIPQVLIPFLSQYSNHSSLFGISLATVGVASGILAAYGVAVIVLSSLYWMDSKPKTWHWLHYLSYFVILAVFIHALGTGSDLRYGLFRTAWILVFVVVLIAILSRLWRTGTLRKRELIHSNQANPDHHNGKT
jgi:methionine sulfoxide reductase heme-binding subunit